MSDAQKLVVAIPSKGRMMDDAAAVFGAVGLAIAKTGDARGYRGEMAGMADVEVQFVSSSEIARLLRAGDVHLGITGADLIGEASAVADDRVVSLKALGFGRADVVVAVPAFWLDVHRLAELELMGLAFRRRHGRRMRVATKYLNLTRRFFAANGVASYRIVESGGATEGAPAAGLAELIVDITTTGSTLKANHLRVLDDGLILASEAHLFTSRAAAWTSRLEAVQARLKSKLNIA